MFFSGTQHYCPPEFYSDHCFLGSQATVWQLGFLLAEMVAGEMPYVKPRMALYMRPSIPNHLSAGEKILPWLSVVEGLACSRFSVSGMIEKAGTSRDKGDPACRPLAFSSDRSHWPRAWNRLCRFGLKIKVLPRATFLVTYKQCNFARFSATDVKGRQVASANGASFFWILKSNRIFKWLFLPFVPR